MRGNVYIIIMNFDLTLMTLGQKWFCVQFEGKDTRAIIMVPSLPDRRDRRENVRQTWGRSRYSRQIMVYFVVGKVKSGDYAVSLMR